MLPDLPRQGTEVQRSQGRSQLEMVEPRLSPSVSGSEVYALPDLLHGNMQEKQRQEAACGLCMGMEVRQEPDPCRVRQSLKSLLNIPAFCQVPGRGF